MAERERESKVQAAFEKFRAEVATKPGVNFHLFEDGRLNTYFGHLNAADSTAALTEIGEKFKELGHSVLVEPRPEFLGGGVVLKVFPIKN